MLGLSWVKLILCLPYLCSRCKARYTLACTKCEVHDQVCKHATRCTKKYAPRFLIFEALYLYLSIYLSVYPSIYIYIHTVFRVGSSLKYHLSLMQWQKSLKSLHNSGSLNFLCIGVKLRPFSRIFISVSVWTFLLRLNTASDKKLPDNLYCSVRTDGMLIWDYFNRVSWTLKVFKNA